MHFAIPARLVDKRSDRGLRTKNQTNYFARWQSGHQTAKKNAGMSPNYRASGTPQIEVEGE
jgi:hypothetical protein